MPYSLLVKHSATINPRKLVVLVLDEDGLFGNMTKRVVYNDSHRVSQLSDIYITCRRVKFPAHKAILVRGTDFFANILKKKWTDVSGVDLEDRVDVIAAALSFLYDNDYHYPVGTDHDIIAKCKFHIDIYTLADFLGCPELKEYCIGRFRSDLKSALQELDPSNAIEVGLVACVKEIYNSKISNHSLRRAAVETFQQNIGLFLDYVSGVASTITPALFTAIPEFGADLVVECARVSPQSICPCCDSIVPISNDNTGGCINCPSCGQDVFSDLWAEISSEPPRLPSPEL